MNIKLIAHTKLVDDVFLIDETGDNDWVTPGEFWDCTDGQQIALTAIRTCYSSNKPSEIVEEEGEKYFDRLATDGKEGTEADRLIRHIVNSGHLSTLEHITFTFAIEDVSRALLAQLTRHRVGFSYSVQSQRYVKLESDSKSGGFDYVMPSSLKDDYAGAIYFGEIMQHLQECYDDLRKNGVPAEDARMILPQAATCNLVMTCNLRSLLDFYKKRSSNHAQWEIRELAENLKEEVIQVEKWTKPFFEVKA